MQRLDSSRGLTKDTVAATMTSERRAVPSPQGDVAGLAGPEVAHVDAEFLAGSDEELGSCEEHF